MKLEELDEIARSVIAERPRSYVEAARLLAPAWIELRARQDAERLLRIFAPQTPVAATIHIFDAVTGYEVDEGTRGVIVRRDRDVPLYTVRWANGAVFKTTAASFDPVTE